MTFHDYIASLGTKRITVLAIGVSKTPLIRRLAEAGGMVTARDLADPAQRMRIQKVDPQRAWHVALCGMPDIYFTLLAELLAFPQELGRSPILPFFRFWAFRWGKIQIRGDGKLCRFLSYGLCSVFVYD